MAKQFLVSLNLNKNELQNAVIQNLATAPENAKEGQIYFDTVKKAFFVYQNGVWVTFVGTGVYEAKVAELEQAIAGKVAQADYDVKVAALEAKDAELAGAIATKVAQADYDAKVAELVAEDAKKVAKTEYEAKVAEIEGALATKAEQATTLAGYGITDAYTKEEVQGLISSVYKFRGSVETVEDLPTEGNTEGDVYNVKATGENFAWVAPAEGETEGHWDDLGGDIDLSNYYTKEEVDTKLDEKDCLPEQDGNAGKALVTDGANTSWDYTTVIKNVDEGTEVGSSKLIINKLSQTKYDELAAAGLINENELYITSDDKEYYTKEEVDAIADTKVALDSYNTDKAGLEEEIAGKVAQGEYDAKVAELEGAIAGKVAQGEYDAKVEELTGAISGNTAAIATKVAQADYDAKVEELEQAITDLEGKDAAFELAIDGVNQALATKVAQDEYDAKVAELEGAIAGLQTSSVNKVKENNPELAPVGGVATWMVAHNFGDDVIVSLKEVATGEEVVADVVQGENMVTIKFNAEATVAADTYAVTIMG